MKKLVALILSVCLLTACSTTGAPVIDEEQLYKFTDGLIDPLNNAQLYNNFDTYKEHASGDFLGKLEEIMYYIETNPDGMLTDPGTYEPIDIKHHKYVVTSKGNIQHITVWSSALMVETYKTDFYFDILYNTSTEKVEAVREYCG